MSVKRVPDWSKSGNLYDIGIVLLNAILPSIGISSRHKNALHFEPKKLKARDDIHVNFQHGDFSINNLIYTQENCKIIDLEDFDELTFPLFDSISLAISFTDNYANGMTVKNVLNELNSRLSQLKKSSRRLLYVNH